MNYRRLWGKRRADRDMRGACSAILLFLLGFLMLLPAGAWAPAGPEDAAGRLISATGQVAVSDAGGAGWSAAEPGRYLLAGQSVRTGADGWAALLMADETLVQLNRETLFALKQVSATAGWRF